MEYDAQGRLTKVTDALNQSMTFTYEGPDPVSVIHPQLPGTAGDRA